MTESRPPARQPPTESGLIGRFLAGLANAVKWLALSLMMSIVLEWVGLHFWWSEQGLEHSRTMLENELGFLREDFTQSLISSSPVTFATNAARFVHYWLFDVTRVAELFRGLARPLPPMNSAFEPIFTARCRHWSSTPPPPRRSRKFSPYVSPSWSYQRQCSRCLAWLA